MRTFNKVLLFSGGIDSYILYHFIKKWGWGAQSVYFNLGHKYARKEMDIVKKTLNPIIDESFNLERWEDINSHIPFRNLLFAMGASVYGVDEVFIGGVKDDNVYDNKRPVHDEMTGIISRHLDKYVKVTAPFIDAGMTKADIVHWFIRYRGQEQAQKELLENTYSCFSGDEECMECKACFRKFSTLYSFGMAVPKFKGEDVAHAYLTARFSYPPHRENMILNYLAYSGFELYGKTAQKIT